MSGTYRHLRSWIVTWLLRQHKPCWTPTPCGQCAIRLSMERWRAGFQRGRPSVTLCILQLNVGFFCNLLLTFCNVRNLLNINGIHLRFKCLRGAQLCQRNKSRLQGKGPMCFGEMSLLAEFESFLLTAQPWRSRCLPKCVPFLSKDCGWCGLNVYFWYPASWTQMMQSFYIYLVTHYLRFLCLYAAFGILACSASCEEDLLQKLQLLGVSVWSIGLWGWSHPIFPWLWHKGQVA